MTEGSTTRRKSRWDAEEATSIKSEPSAKSPEVKSRSRWDDSTPKTKSSRWDDAMSKASSSRWDEETPKGNSSRWDEATPKVSSSRWDEATPKVASSKWDEATPQVHGRTAQWEETPVLGGGLVLSQRPELLNALRAEKDAMDRNQPWTAEALDALLPDEGYRIVEPPADYQPERRGPRDTLTPLLTPLTSQGGGVGGFREDFFHMVDGDLHADDLRALQLAETQRLVDQLKLEELRSDLPPLKAEDREFFPLLLKPKDGASSGSSPSVDGEESKEAAIQAALLKIKNGTPMMRKAALRMLTERAREYGPDLLFRNVLPLLMSPSLEDQERHLLVKVIDRLLFKLGEQVRAYVPKILVVIEPLLIEENPFARQEGREILANLAKAAGLPTMIAAMRKHVDSPDDFVRNLTARTLAVVASALGIPSLLRFLQAVSASKKSWMARHTGMRVVQQIALLTGVAVLPHLTELVETVAAGLDDEQASVRSIAALAVAALAEASSPYGIESFDAVLKPLWAGIHRHRSRVLAAFLKAIGNIIPLMLPEYASFYTREVMGVLLREFASPESEMRRTVLLVVRQCVGTEGVSVDYIRTDILPKFLEHFWVRRITSDALAHRPLQDATVAIAQKIGAAPVLEAIVVHLKDENENFRRLTAETIDSILSAPTLLPDSTLLQASSSTMFHTTSHHPSQNPSQGQSQIPGNPSSGPNQSIVSSVAQVSSAAMLRKRLAMRTAHHSGGADLSGVGQALEERLVDGMQYAFFESTTAEESAPKAMLRAFSNLLLALGLRATPYLAGILSTLKWRLNNKQPSIRQQSADLVAVLSPALVRCGQEAQLIKMAQVLFEYLGEEYPEVLGSILNALRAVINVVGMERMEPPIGELLPRLTPILRNRNERVQEAIVDLVGRIADRGHTYVAPREWVRICFELLELLKAPRKAIRRAAASTFGYISNAIGPHDVIPTLLNNLRVQDRTNRVVTTVAIAIVSETCGPFTVLPALMNEYMVPEMKVQQGVLKSLAFMFEYIARSGSKDYIYSVVTLLVDALMDRDTVHRQTACIVVKHLAIGVYGLGCEDAVAHLLNYVWPNIFETSPHVIRAVHEAIEACRLALGPTALLQLLLQGLFHPARRVREVYWKIYNTVYIASADALVPAFPRIVAAKPFRPEIPGYLPSSADLSDDVSEMRRDYSRHELEFYL